MKIKFKKNKQNKDNKEVVSWVHGQQFIYIDFSKFKFCIGFYKYTSMV